MTRAAFVLVLIAAYAFVAYVLASLVRPDLAVFAVVVVMLASILHVWVSLERWSDR